MGWLSLTRPHKSLLLGSMLIAVGWSTWACTPQVPGPRPVDTPTGQIPAVRVPPCPDPADTADNSQARLPSGANWARICGTSLAGIGQGGKPGSGVLQGPPDALVTNLDGLVGYVNSLPVAGNNLACTDEFGPAYTLVIGYPDGTTRKLTGELYGCRVVGNRLGATEVLNDFGARLRAQRAAFPELAPIVENCVPGFGESFVQPTMAETTSAYVVAPAHSAAAPETREITEWERLRTVILAESRPYSQVIDPSASVVSVVHLADIHAINQQCEALYLQIAEDGVHWCDPGGEAMIWQPSPTEEAIVQDYLDWAVGRR